MNVNMDAIRSIKEGFGLGSKKKTAQQKRIDKVKKSVKEKKNVKAERKKQRQKTDPDYAKKKSKEKQNEVLDMLAAEMKKRKNTDVLKF